MDNKEVQTLQEWMSQSDPGAWLQAHPEHLETLSPYLGVDRAIASRMSAFAFASEPSGAALARGRSRLMAAVNDRTPSIASSGLRTWRPAHAGAMVAVALAAIGLATG